MCGLLHVGESTLPGGRMGESATSGISQSLLRLGFTLACQTILASWMLLATGSCRDPRRLWTAALARIARNEVANRPGRIEPRVLKRRRHRYPLMRRSRQELREEIGKT